MKTIFFKHSLALILIAGLFISCEKNNEVNSMYEGLNIQEYNKEITQSFFDEFSQITFIKSSFDKTSKKFDREKVKELFIEYFNDYKIEVEGEIYSLSEYEDFSSIDLYYSTLEKIYKFENYETNGLKSSPTKEEIRDALKEECGKYIWGVSDYCKLAVDIAYILS